MKTFKYEFETGDNFEKGNCLDCPFLLIRNWHYDDGYINSYEYCLLKNLGDDCPLVEVGNENL